MRFAALLLVAGTLWAQRWNPVSLGEVTPSPDGGTAAWVQSSQIFLARPGAPPVQLTRGDRAAAAPSFSPDGRWVYFRYSRSGRANIWRVALEGGEAEQITDFPGDLGAYQLSPDGRSLAFLGSTAAREEIRVLDENPRYQALWIAPSRRLFTPSYDITAFTWTPDSRTIAFVHQPTPGAEYALRSDLSEVDVETGQVTPLASTAADEREPHYSPDGRYLTFLRSSEPPRSPRDYRIVLLPRRGGEARVLPATYDELPELLGWSADSSGLFYTEGKGFRRILYAMPLDGPPQPVYEPRGGTIAGARLNAAGTHAGFIQEGSGRPPEAFVLPLSTGSPSQVSRANSSLPRITAETRLVRWKGPDGWDIEGLLTLPAGYEPGQRCPLILYIHGGPHSAFTDSYLGRGTFPLAEWAERGYALLRPNPRGSTNYGKAFRYANMADWGGKDYQDNMAGVDHVIGTGVADPGRLAVAGWSYGGYMTAWTITQTRRFKAAAVGAGVSDILSQSGTSDIRSNKIEAFGAPWNDPSEYLKRSPLLRLKGVTTPTLILHGEADERVPISQGYELYHALRRIGVPARMVLYPRTGHAVTEPKFVADVQQRLLEWMDRWLGPRIDTNFEGGSLGRVEQVSPTHFRCAVRGEADQDGRNRQANWYYFRLESVAGQDLIIDLVDLVGEYNYRPGTHAVTRDTHPVYSYDQRNWQHFESIEWDEKEIRLRVRFRAERSPVWIAHVPPYTNRDLDRLLNAYRSHPHLRREVIGKTVGSRDMLLLTVTNPSVPDAGKKVAWLMFRQHSWETGSSWAGEGALRFLLSDDARALRDGLIWKIFPLADPDGVARGGVRFNAHGYDLNRNWDAVEPQKMPEIAAQQRAVLGWVDAGRRLDLFLTVHNTETAEYLEGPPVPVVERFYRTLVETTTFAPTRPPRAQEASTTPGKPGRMTVAQGLYHDRKIPAMIMEQRIDRNPKLGRFPAVEDRLQFGAGLVRAIAQALGLPRK